jgi:hypothetical protein
MKKMVRGARGLGYALGLGSVMRDKLNKTDESSNGEGSDDAEVMVFAPAGNIAPICKDKRKYKGDLSHFAFLLYCAVI